MGQVVLLDGSKFMKTIDQALHEKNYPNPIQQLLYFTFKRPNGDISQATLPKK
jgi:hypothetical protein